MRLPVSSRARRGASAGASGLALALAACGGGGDATPDAPTEIPDGAVPRQVVTESVSLPLNETVEAILVGGVGDQARIQMTAGGAPIDWNLHGHANGGTQVVNEGFKVPMVDYAFSPTAKADWYLLMRNKGQTDITVELKIDLFGEMTWSGYQ
jgi:hypothetical protein